MEQKINDGGPAFQFGTWRVFKGQHRNPATDEYESFHYVAGSTPVCDILSFGDDDKESDAIASLISAAPDLLRALIAFREVDAFKGWHHNYAEAIEKAEAAIAKATPITPTADHP